MVDEAATIGIYIGDDEPSALESAKTLSEYVDMTIVGASRDIRVVLHEVVEKRPEILLLDVVFTGQTVDGITAFERLRRKVPTLKALFWSLEDRHSERARRAGAKGYITKPVKIEVVANAIRTIHEGGHYFDVRPTPSGAQRPSRRLPDLTQKEFKLLEALRAEDDLSNQELAARLGTKYPEDDWNFEKVREAVRVLFVKFRVEARGSLVREYTDAYRPYTVPGRDDSDAHTR